MKKQPTTMKLAEAIERVQKLELDCLDLKGALTTLEDNNGAETTEAFYKRCAESQRVSIQVLMSSLVVLEDELKVMLDSEIVIKEVPGE